MKKKAVIIILVGLFLGNTTGSFLAFAQTSCTVTNHTFKAGEQFNYKICYSWGPIWVLAGEAVFSVETEKLNNRTMYHFTGLGATYPKYDGFYRVRDRYESVADTSYLKPLRFSRQVQEASNVYTDDYVFNFHKDKVYSSFRKHDAPLKLDSVKITPCTNDVMTAIFYARCLDFSKYKPNDTIPITFVLGKEVFPTYIRYMGKETIKNDSLGKVRCIKFRAKLIAGTLFKGGEKMTVWVTDDENKMPVYVETEIFVGKIKVYLTKYKGLRNKMDCLLK